MGLTGKYKFSGIQKTGSAFVRAALLNTPFAWIVKIPFFNAILELALNWMANNGLVVMNLGAYKVGDAIDAAGLEKAIESGIEAAESGRKLTPEEIKRIDDEVIKAADKALPYGRKPTKP